jgi:hypothetical protein
VSAAVGIEGGWVALGNRVDGTAGELWFSEDGLRWETVLHVEDGPPGLNLADLDRTPIGLVAVGTVTSEDGSYDGAIWRSVDGRSWERMGPDDPDLVGVGEAQLHRVVGHAGGIFVTGIFGTAEERARCEELIGMVASLSERPPRPRSDATSCMTGSEQQWASADGVAWRRIDPAAVGGLRPIEFRVVVAGGPGLVVLGETTAPASPDTALFTSPDGVEWTPVGPPGPIQGDVAIGLVARGREVVAVTERWDGAASSFRVWIGTAR